MIFLTLSRQTRTAPRENLNNNKHVETFKDRIQTILTTLGKFPSLSLLRGVNMKIECHACFDNALTPHVIIFENLMSGWSI